jgi:glycosyltransferase involved in cell wall biosynthesis
MAEIGGPENESGTGALVSVVMPVFNHEELAREALESVLEQTYTNIEVIVVDDASQDPIAEMVSSLADPRLRYIRLPTNLGAGGARNRGLAEASGALIAFIDSDDLWIPTKLETHIAYLEAPEGDGSRRDVSTTAYMIERRDPGASAETIREIRTPGHLQSQSHMVWGCSLSPGSTLLMRREIYEEFGGFDETLRRLEDWDWLLRVMERTPVYVLQDTLSVIRVGRWPDYRTVRDSCRRFGEKHKGGFRAMGVFGSWRLNSTLHLEMAASAYRDDRRVSALCHGAACIFLWPLRDFGFYVRLFGRFRQKTELSKAQRRPARVVHVISGLGVGGAERFLTNFITNDRSGTNIHHVVSLQSDGYYAKQLADAGISVTQCGARNPWTTLAAVLRAVRAIRKPNPDVVLGWMYHGNLIASLGAFGLGARVIWGIRCSDMDLSRYRAQLRFVVRTGRWLSFMPDAAVLNSQAGLRSHQAAGYRCRNMMVIENGFDTERFQPDQDRRVVMRDALGIPRDAVVCATIARVDPMKDYPLYLGLAGDFPNVVFLAVGSGTDKLGGPPNYRGLGVRHDIEDLLRACDVMVSTSLFGEGLSNAIGEAMASGLPVVATNVGDAARLVGGGGIIVPPGNRDAFRDALGRLTESDDLRRTLGRRARARIVSRFRLDQAVTRMTRVLRDNNPVLHRTAGEIASGEAHASVHGTNAS